MKGILMRPEVWQAKLRVLEQYGEAQTRRLGGLKSINQEPGGWIFKEIIQEIGGRQRFRFKDAIYNIYIDAYPRYHIGETVYIKEAWWVYNCIGTLTNIKYMRDGFVTWVHIPKDKPNPRIGYHSPMMMPEYAARYFIVIEQVGAGRVQEIGLNDLKAEGLSWENRFGIDFEWRLVKYVLTEDFKKLWDTINPKYPWESNPWVFPYTFKLKEAR